MRMYQKQNMTFTLQIYTKPFLVKTLANSVLFILFFTLIHDLKKKKNSMPVYRQEFK